MRRFIPQIAGTLLTAAFELSVAMGLFSGVPRWVLDGLWIVPVGLWAYWVVTNDTVRRYRHGHPMMALALFASVGAAAGVALWALTMGPIPDARVSPIQPGPVSPPA